jgi:hypothetical protein
MKEKKPNRIICRVCGEGFPNEAELKKHSKAAHVEPADGKLTTELPPGAESGIQPKSHS